MSIQDQHQSTVGQTQDAWTGIVESLTENTKAFRFNPPVPTVDPSYAIDQVFDFWAQTLEAEREVCKQIAHASIAATEQFRTQAEKLGAAVLGQAVKVGGAVREQAEAVQRRELDQVSSKYEDLTKDELQVELANRHLTKSGSVDELRERLVADDLR